MQRRAVSHPYDEEKKVRNYCIMIMLALGLSRSDVAYVFDISKERVRQVSDNQARRMRLTVRNKLGAGYYQRLVECELGARLKS